MKALATSIAACALLVLSPATYAQQDLWDQAETACENQRFDQALSVYEQLAQKGSAQAAETAGMMLLYGEALYGKQVRQDRPRAALLLQRAAKDGRPVAQFMLRKIARAY